MIAGVYAITNNVTGKVYVGFGLDVVTRMTAHIRSLGLGKHFSRTLQADWDTMGADAFTIELVEEVSGDLDTQVEAEERWIALAMALPPGAYNRHRSCKSRASVMRSFQRRWERNHLHLALERLEQIMMSERNPKKRQPQQRRPAQRSGNQDAAVYLWHGETYLDDGDAVQMIAVSDFIRLRRAGIIEPTDPQNASIFVAVR